MIKTIRPLISENLDTVSGKPVPLKRDHSEYTLNPGYANQIATTLDGDKRSMILGVKVFDVIRNMSNIPRDGYRTLENGWEVHHAPTSVGGYSDEAFERANQVRTRDNVSIKKGNKYISIKVFVNQEGKVITVGRVDLPGGGVGKYVPLENKDREILELFLKDNSVESK